jgi:hypothetical protein
MTENQKEIWQKTHAQGKLRFILVRGIIFWGLPFGIVYFVLTRIFYYFFDGSSFSESINNLTAKFIFNLLIWSLGGCILKWMEWNKMKRESLGKDFENK